MAVKPLQAVNQHWPILLLEDVTTDLDDSVRADANEQPVECGVVELAERKSVRYPRVSAWFTVGHDVGGIEQLVVPEAALARQARTEFGTLAAPVPGNAADEAGPRTRASRSGAARHLN